MSKINRLIILLLTICFLFACAAGCSSTFRQKTFDVASITSYRGIPDITEDEITAIEELKASRQNFSFGYVPSTEAFELSDGVIDGFVPMFFELMTNLFDIPFVPQAYTWADILNGLENMSINFTAEMTPTADRHEIYQMSSPIAQRSLAAVTYGDSVRIDTEYDV